MADDQRNAQVVLTADTSNYQQGMAQATNSTNSAVTAVGKLLDGVNRLTVSAGKKLIGIGAVESAGLIAATAAAGKLEHQMDQLKASSVITGRSFDDYSKSVTALRTTMGLTTGEAVALVTQLNSLGQNSQSIQSLSQTFVRLGTVTGEAVGGLVDGLISLQRQMGTEGASSTERFASSLASLSQKAGVSATSVLQFANSIAPIAKVAGVTQTELMGISTAFAKVGQDGFAATNAFNKFLTGITSAIQSGSPELAAYANLIGKTADEFKNMNKTDAITQIFNEINRQGPDAIKTLERFGLDGVRSYKAIQALAASGGLQDSINTAMEGQKDTTKFLSSSQEALNGLTENLSKLGQTLQTIGEAFGRSLVGPASAAISVLSGLLSPIASIVSSLGSIPAVAGVAMAGITLLGGTLLKSFGILTAAAGFQSLRRNSLGSGFRQGAGRDLNFSDPMYAQRMRDGTASPLMRAMYGTGQWTGQRLGGFQQAYSQSRNNYYTNRGEPIPTSASMMARVSGVGGTAVRGLGSFMRSGLTSLYPSSVYDPSSQQRAFGKQVQPYGPMALMNQRLLGLGTPLSLPEKDPAALTRMDRGRIKLADWGSHWGGTPTEEGGTTGGIKESSKSLGTAFSDTTKSLKEHGTELNKSAGLFRSLGSESKNLALSLGKAAIGGGAIIGGAATKGLARGIGGIASSAMGMVGGPIGVAAIGGMALYESNKSKNDILDKIASNTEDVSAISAYRAALGEATTGTMDFATATKTAADLIKKNSGGADMTKSQAITLTSQDITDTREGKYTDPRVEKLNRAQAVSFASVALANASPKDARLLSMDIAKRFPDDVNAIMKEAYNAKPDVSGLWSGIQS